MNIDQFNASLAGKEPPPGLSTMLQALWHDAHGNWARAHKIVQGEDGKEAAAVHAYLHRKEGDLSNADYWYERAQRTRPAVALGAEWDALVRYHLEGAVAR